MTTSVVLLGTAGGAMTYTADAAPRFGTSSALVVDGLVYLVDAGQGAARQLARASLPGTAHRDLSNFERLRAVFLSHLHSDHTMDLPNILLCGYFEGWPDSPVEIVGPWAWDGHHSGTVGMVAGLEAAFEADLDDRTRSAGKTPLSSRLRVQGVVPPEDVRDVDPERAPAPSCVPFEVYRDPRVRVTATLVSHGPVHPALAYRFDTADGSVVFSGDTSPCDNLVALAEGADALVHEAIDPDWGGALTGGEGAALAAAPVLAKHTLATEVGRIAERAGVSTLVLTHLTPGDADPAVWRQAQRGFGGRLVVGEDLIEVPIAPR